MKEIVIDASVALHWFLKEDDSLAARVLMDDCISRELKITVPDLLFLEVANALKAQEEVSQTMVEDALKGLWGLKLDVAHLDEKLLTEANRLAHISNITVNDAVYLALAGQRGCKLITADLEIVEAAREAGIENLRGLWE